MDLTELTKDAKTMQEVMQKARNNDLKLKLYDVCDDVKIEIIDAQKDYALVKESLPNHLIGDAETFIHPYGGKIGYML